MLYTLKALSHDRLFLAKLTLSIATTWLAGGLTGSYFARELFALPRAYADPHIFLAAASVSPSQPASGNTDAIIAVQSEKIIQMAGENQAGKDDRKILHDELAKAHDIETDHFNKLNDRLNVDEAKVFTTLWLIGVVFGILQVIPTVLTIADYRARRMKQE